MYNTLILGSSEDEEEKEEEEISYVGTCNSKDKNLISI
jgi:hypothetical protein